MDWLPIAASAERHSDRRRVAAAEPQRCDVLHLEKEMRGPRGYRVAGVALLHEENAKLRRLLTDLTLDKHVLGEVVRKSLRPAAQALLIAWVRGAYGASLSRAWPRKRHCLSLW